MSIAHALGGLDGKNYLNCKECFESAYQRGVRVFEVDLLETSDGALVAMHSGFEAKSNLPSPFTLSEFKNARIVGAYTPLTLEDIAELTKRYSDWILVPDLKSDHSKSLRAIAAAIRAHGIDPSSRVIPQIYDFDEIGLTRELGFSAVILTLYKMKNPNENVVLQFLRDNRDVAALTIPIGRFNPAIAARVRTEGCQLFVHTVNDPEIFRRVLNEGASGIYTDVLF